MVGSSSNPSISRPSGSRSVKPWGPGHLRAALRDQPVADGGQQSMGHRTVVDALEPAEATPPVAELLLLAAMHDPADTADNAAVAPAEEELGAGDLMDGIPAREQPSLVGAKRRDERPVVSVVHVGKRNPGAAIPSRYGLLYRHRGVAVARPCGRRSETREQRGYHRVAFRTVCRRKDTSMARPDQGECSPEQDEAAAVLRPVTRSATDATGSAVGCTLRGAGRVSFPSIRPPNRQPALRKRRGAASR
jgi:hypothetical protein